MTARRHTALLGIVMTIALSMSSGFSYAKTAEGIDARCNALKTADFSHIEDAPTHITDTEPMDAAGEVPAYCQVQGYVMPQVGFEIRLPISNWNGKFMHLGCGGMCGEVFTERGVCDLSLQKGYAC